MYVCLCFFGAMMRKLEDVCAAYGADWQEMIYWMIEEAYGEMWKDVEKERYDAYTD